jgi:hypothetical protein
VSGSSKAAIPINARVFAIFCDVPGRPVASGLQAGTMHPLGICRISKTNMLMSPLKTLDTLSHPCVASVESPWLETNHFQKCMCMQDAFCNVKERIM